MWRELVGAGDMTRTSVLLFVVIQACSSADKPCSNWTQWGQSAGHNGNVCVGGQPPAKILGTVAVDPFGSQETASDGDLRVHYQVPLVAGDDVYLLGKGGAFTTPCEQPDGGEVACYAWNSQSWGEHAYHWNGGTLEPVWTAASSWKPVPSEFASAEPLFQPVLSGDFLYMPAVAGAIVKIDRHRGGVLATIKPENASFNDDTYVSGPLVADDKGNVYYNAILVDHDKPVLRDANGWLVRVTPDGRSSALSYTEILAGSAPTGKSCHTTYTNMTPRPPRPWPPLNPDGSTILPPLVECGTQRPGLNVAPAVGADGTLFTVSRAQHTSQDSFLVALRPDLSTKWVRSLRDILNDGCGVTVPSDGDAMTNPFHCRPGAPMGVDIQTGQMPAGRVIDESSSSPAALPDGAVVYGAYTLYNGDRGHLLKFSADGTPAGSYDFGWDYTPAVFQHNGTYSLVVKDNHYNFDDNGTPLGPYYITQISAGMQPEWQFKSTNTQSCTLDAQSHLTCMADHPFGFEWCINAPAVDRDGTVYAGGEDGVVYAIGQGGVDKGHLFLSMSLGASYTPLSIDYKGRLYTQNDGTMSVVGR
jgi:outer membrane protein assembly factor BamB